MSAPDPFDYWLDYWKSRERVALAAIPDDMAEVDEWRDLRRQARYELLVEAVGVQFAPRPPQHERGPNRFVAWLVEGDAVPGVCALVSCGRLVGHHHLDVRHPRIPEHGIPLVMPWAGTQSGYPR